jgi:hypothetical protein
MRLADLSPQTLETIKSYRWDRIIEKHEGPETWSSVLKYYDPEFMAIGEHYVLLPISQEHHDNITILRYIMAEDQSTLVIFLKDTTFVQDPKYELFSAGFVAICDKPPHGNFFIAILYHEWFIIENHST